MSSLKDGIEIPAQAMINMKANFVLPEMEEDYGEVFYTDLDPNQAQDLINQYNKEALDAGCDMNKPVKDYKNRNAMKRTQRGVMQPIGMMWPGTEFQRLDQEAKNQRLQQTNVRTFNFLYKGHLITTWTRRWGKGISRKSMGSHMTKSR